MHNYDALIIVNNHAYVVQPKMFVKMTRGLACYLYDALRQCVTLVPHIITVYTRSRAKVTREARCTCIAVSLDDVWT